MYTLSAEEKTLIQGLNAPQILARYPDLVRKLIVTAKSVTSILTELGVTPTNNSARRNIKNFAEEEKLTLPVYSRDMDESVKDRELSLEAVRSRLILGDKFLGSSLRNWIIRFDIIPYKCATLNCPANESPLWNGKPLTLDLDHRNGSNKDNRVENLRFLCPNCHSQTETYKGRNSRRTDETNLTSCSHCGEATWNGNLCALCSPPAPSVKTMKIVEREKNVAALPPIEVLKEELKSTSRKSVRQKYGISVDALKTYLATGIYTYKPLEERVKAKYPPLNVLVARITADGYEVLSRELGVSGNAIRKYVCNRLGFVPKRGDVVDVSEFLES